MEQKIVDRKNRQVLWCFHLIIMVVLLSGGIAAICMALYYAETSTATEAASKKFRDEFQAVGQTVVNHFQSTLSQSVALIQNFALGVTSYGAAVTAAAARQENQSWPFMTVLDYEYTAGATARLAQLLALNLAPRVEYEQRQKWEEYSVQHQGWLAEGLAIQQQQMQQQQPGGNISTEVEVHVQPIHDTIITTGSYDDYAVTYVAGPFFPMWQMYPVIDYPAPNVDMMDENYYRYLLLTGRSLLPESTDYSSLSDPELETTPRTALLKYYLESNTGLLQQLPYEDDPIVDIYVPGK